MSSPNFDIKQHSKLRFDASGLKGWMGRLYVNKISGPINELLDNARDAAKEGNIKDAECMIKYSKAPYRPDIELLSITNHARNILAMEEILQFAKSSKDRSGVTVGENGVGTLQACNILSKMTLIITTNGSNLSIGVIPDKEEVMVHICHLAWEKLAEKSYKFSYASDIDLKVYNHVKLELGDLGVDVRNEVTQVLDKATADNNNDKLDIFYLLLVGKSNELVEDDKSLEDVKDQIESVLPELYLGNVKIKYKVNDNLIKPCCWQERLAEFSKYELGTPKNVNVYLGFDPLLAPKNVSTAMMYLYSAGRLIEKKKDPRKLLDVAYTGSTFLSGLTIIIDDRNTGKERYFQPNPTKENIQELEKKLSKIQDISNVYKMYYNYHYNFFKSYQTPLQKFREAIVKSKVANSILKVRVSALDTGNGVPEARIVSKEYYDIATLDLNSFEAVKRKMKSGKQVWRMKVNTYKPGLDSTRVIKRPPTRMRTNSRANQKKRKAVSADLLHESSEEESSTSEEESSTSGDEDSESEDDSASTYGKDGAANSSTKDDIENMKKDDIENMKNVIMNLKRTNQQLSSQNQGLNNTVILLRQSLEALKQKFTLTKQNLEAENAMQVTRIQILERMVASNNSIVGNSTSNSCEIDSFTITSGSSSVDIDGQGYAQQQRHTQFL